MREIIIEKNTGSLVHIPVSQKISSDAFNEIYSTHVAIWTKAHKEDDIIFTRDANGYSHSINARRIVDIYKCERKEPAQEKEEDQMLKTDQS